MLRVRGSPCEQVGVLCAVSSCSGTAVRKIATCIYNTLPPCRPSRNTVTASPSTVLAENKRNTCTQTENEGELVSLCSKIWMKKVVPQVAGCPPPPWRRSVMCGRHIIVIRASGGLDASVNRRQCQGGRRSHHSLTLVDPLIPRLSGCSEVRTNKPHKRQPQTDG